MSAPAPPSKPAQKFAFDNDFFDVTVAPAGTSAAGITAPAAVTLGPSYMPRQEEKLAAAREEGYATGLNEGRAQAAAAAAVEVAELKNQLLALTRQWDAAQQAWQQHQQREALSLLRLTLHHLIGHAASHYPDQLLEHYLHDLLPLLRSSDELTLHLHPQARHYHEKLGLPQASIGGRPFQIQPNSSLGPADVLIEWRGGGLEARLPDILARVDTLLAGAGANTTLPVPAAPEASGFNPATAAAHPPAAPQASASPEAAPEPAPILDELAAAQKARADALLGDDT